MVLENDIIGAPDFVMFLKTTTQNYGANGKGGMVVVKVVENGEKKRKTIEKGLREDSREH